MSDYSVSCSRRDYVDFARSPCCYFTFCIKFTLTEISYSEKIYRHIKFQGPVLKGIIVVPTAQIHTRHVIIDARKQEHDITEQKFILMLLFRHLGLHAAPFYPLYC
jgi:hypothetical protein